MGMMVLALKVLALFTLSVGALSFESIIFIYSWMPAHGALVIRALLGAIIGPFFKISLKHKLERT